jgi:hypothetical protein
VETRDVFQVVDEWIIGSLITMYRLQELLVAIRIMVRKLARTVKKVVMVYCHVIHLEGLR